jgi:hypothetical protein
MKRFLPILMLSAIVMQTFSTLIIIANYEINKSYITQNFCENKNKPKMNCNGQCHLNKQLQKQEKNENAPANPIKEKTQIQLFCQSNVFGYMNSYSEKNIYAPYSEKEISSPFSSLFHPPQC